MKSKHQPPCGLEDLARSVVLLAKELDKLKHELLELQAQMKAPSRRQSAQP